MPFCWNTIIIRTNVKTSFYVAWKSRKEFPYSYDSRRMFLKILVLYKGWTYLINRFLRNTFIAKIFFLFRFDQLCCHLPLAVSAARVPWIFFDKTSYESKITNQRSWSLGLILLITILLLMMNVHLALKLKILQHVDAIISYKHFW